MSPAPMATLSKVPIGQLDAILTMGGYQALAEKKEAAEEYERSQQQQVMTPADYPMPELRGDALKFWESTEPEIVLSGPAETGKTFAACHKLNMLMWKYPGAQAAIIRKVYTTMNGTVLQTFRRVLGQDSPVRLFGGERPEFYDYPNGSRIWVGGLDNPQKSLSSERDFIYVNQAEELELADHEVLTTRCTGRGGVAPFSQLMEDCNPGPATHWILNRPSLRVLYSRHEDNPTLFDQAGNITPQGERSLRTLDNLTGPRKKRLRYGLWVGAEGMVYESWDRSVHVVDAARLREWGIFDEDGDLLRPALDAETGQPNNGAVRDVFASVDWGFTNPGVIQVYAIDGDGRAYMVHEVYRTGQLIDWWVSKGIALKERYGITRWFCDPAEPAYIRQFNDGGLNAVGAQNDIPPGIQAVQKRLVVQPDGRARLYVYNAALEERDETLTDKKKPCGLVEERDSYVWQIAKDGRPNKEEPVDADNHAEDTNRYMIYTLDINAIKSRSYALKGRR
jgi:hypothetical protein